MNEVMAKAMTGLDDDLITEAYTAAPVKKKSGPWLRFCAAAACLVLVAVAVSAHQKNKPEIILYGNTLTDEPMPIDMPVVMSSESRMAVFDIVSVPLELHIEKETDITAVHGTMEVFSDETFELLYVGQSYHASDSVAIQWTVQNPEVGQTYELKLNKAVVLLLSYDENENNWVIRQHHSMTIF